MFHVIVSRDESRFFLSILITHNLIEYILGIELLYFKIADKFNIIDKPNNRSSHTAITLRGGGIIFPIAMPVAYGLGFTNWSVTLAVF
ncbi:MAG: hypothetical protein V4497_05960 [Bacteroidota bacterium]